MLMYLIQILNQIRHILLIWIFLIEPELSPDEIVRKFREGYFLVFDDHMKNAN